MVRTPKLRQPKAPCQPLLIAGTSGSCSRSSPASSRPSSSSASGAAGLADARVPHTHVTAYVKADGSRLTELAAQARMTLPAMSELVDDLQRLGIVERRPDPSDGRAKLICLTDAGWEAMRTARGVIADLEARYAGLVGAARFEEAAGTLDALLRALDADAAP